MTSDDESFRSKSYLIIGAGVFGLSTARELLLQGARNVRVIDKSPTLPAPDGSSTDINRIVRSSYSDPLYTSLARESIDLWKKDFPGIYRESGVLVLGNSGYCRLAEENDLAAGANITSVPDRTSLESQFSRDIPLGNFSAVESDTSKGFGYLNHSGGWADARAGMAELRDKVLSLGGVIEPGISLMKITFGGEFQDVALVVTRKANLEKEEDMSEEVITADTVIVATGAWTPSLFPDPELGVTKRMTSVGQSVATIILSEKEYQEYRRIPVVVDFESGFYIFPPNEQRLLKMAIHDGGYINLIDSSNATNLAISTPRTTSTHGDEGLKIPLLMVERLRKGLRSIYPALGNHPFTSTRLCWYTDTQDGDWIIDQHPDYSNIVFATGGSGHAYKFLPVLGRLVVQRIRRQMDDRASAKFAFNRNFLPDEHPDRLNRQTLTLSQDQLSDGRIIS